MPSWWALGGLRLHGLSRAELGRYRVYLAASGSPTGLAGLRIGARAIPGLTENRSETSTPGKLGVLEAHSTSPALGVP